MRAFEFLVEYDRNKTTQTLGRQLAGAFMTGGDKRQYDFYNTAYQHPDGTPDMPVILAQVMSSLEEADPTKNKIYTPWLAREYAKQNIKRLEDAHVLGPMLAEYDKYKKRNDFPVDAKDIMRLNYNQFYTIVGNYEPPPEQIKDKGQAREVYTTSDVRVIIPDNEQAACYYGQGTRWCTAATKGTNYFSRYSSPDRPLYILLPTRQHYDGEKYQLHFGSDQFMNEEDEPINLYELITERFPNLYRYFMETEPEIKEMIPFTDDSLLESIGTQISEIAMDKVWEKITDWELEDDSFKDWQLISAEKMGIINDEMNDEEIWDTIRDNDKLNDYLDYNDDARRFMIDVREALKITPQKMKEIAIGMMEDPDNGEPLHYYNLSVVYANNIEDYFGIGKYRGWASRGRGQEDGEMAEWIREHISISKNGSVSYVR
jgi:hypothetical protein